MRKLFVAVLCAMGWLALGQELLVLVKEVRLPDIGAVAFAPAKGFLAVATARNVALFKADTWEIVRILEGHTAVVSALAFSSDGEYLLTGSWDRTARLWRAETGEMVRVIEGASAWVVAVALHPAGTWVALGSYDERFRMGFIFWTRIDKVWPPRAKLAHGGWVQALAFSSDGKLLASGAADKTVKLWDVETGDEKATFSGHPGGVRSLAFSPDGKLLAVGSWQEAWLWDVATGRRIGTLRGHRDQVRAVAFSPTGEFLATGGGDGWLRIWDVKTFKEVWALQVLSPKIGWVGAGEQGVFSLAFSADGQFLACSSSDGKLRIWQVGQR